MRRRLAESLRSRSRGELIAWALLVAVALALRLYDLGARPFHHDESQDAYFSYILRTGGGYTYDPLLHGPFRFYLTALAYLLFGDSDFTARLAPALMGTILVALPYGLRRQLGGVAAYAAGILLAACPTVLYFSRFAREDIYFACLTMAMAVVAFRLIAAPRGHHPALLAALLAITFSIKESTFITIFVAGSFLIVAVAFQARRAGGFTRAPLVRRGLDLGWEPWAWAVVAFLGVYTVLFTTFFTNAKGVYGLYTGLSYWLGQQPVGRGGEPVYFYVVVLFAHEWPILLLGAVGAVVVARRPTLLGVFAIWAFVVSLAVYSWAGEKFAWLALHPLLPLILLAGLGIQAVWEARRRWYGIAGALVTVLALAYSGYASFLVNAEHGADPREFLVSTQSSTDVKATAEEVLALARKRPRLQVTVDAADGATFPWAWYFRHLNVGYLDMSTGNPPPQTSDVVFLTDESRLRLQSHLIGYDGRRFRFRVWWVRDYKAALDPGDWARWFVHRTPWNPTGGMPEWVYVRRVVTAAG